MTQRFTISAATHLMEQARLDTGIDIIDADVVETISRLVDSYNEEVTLTETSAAMIEQHLLRLLKNRLRMQRDLSAHPEILEQTLQPPVVICGMARTGSTKLHKMLASTGDFNFMTGWQSMNPALHTGLRTESPEARIRDCEDFVDWMNKSSPSLKFTHELAALEPEEETWIHNVSFTTLLLGFAEMVKFPAWLMSQDVATKQMDFLVTALKYLQWQGIGSSSKRWILKTPYYFGMEEPLMNAFPNARLVMTHRHPLETIPSVVSLLKAWQLPINNKSIDFYPFVAGAAMQINRHLEIRRTRKDMEWLDIYYKELVDSAETVLGKVYKFCGMPLTEAAQKRMQDWSNNLPYIKGGHKYSLADAGIKEEKIESDFAPYIALLDELFGRGDYATR